MKLFPPIAASLALFSSITAQAAITYVDALEGSTGNTYATDGTLSDTNWVGSGSGAWEKRAFANDGTIFEALETADPELTTQLAGLADGTYEVWAFFWDNGDGWSIHSGLTSGSLTKYESTGATAATDLNFTNSVMKTEGPRTMYGVKLGQKTVSNGSLIEIYIDELDGSGGGNADRTWYDGVGYELVTPIEDTDGDGLPDPYEQSIIDADDGDAVDGFDDVMGTRMLGVEFNRNDAYAAPSQSLFRIVSGSTTQADNASSFSKTIGSRQVTITQPGGANFEFRGANGDSSRAIPGGDTSLSFLVADFIASRDGAIDLEITNLPAGDYIFRSYHLDTYTGSGLGFAQGTTSSAPNTIEARIGGVLQASVQPTALGADGLGTTFIDDSQVPTLGFTFNHDGASPLVIELRATETNGSESFLLLNGFEIFLSDTP